MACATASVDTSAGSGCASGSVLVGGRCATLCGSSSDCADSEVCNLTLEVCESVEGAENAPRIASVNGTGTPNDTPGHAANHVRDEVILSGTNLAHAAAGFALTIFPVGRVSESFDATGFVASSTDETLSFQLPDTLVVDAEYTIRVANAFGGDQVNVTFLQGLPGTNGAAGAPAECMANCAQAFPGESLVSTLTARGVAHGVPDLHANVQITGAGGSEASLSSDTAPAASSGFVVAFIDRRGTDSTSTAVSHGLSEEIAESGRLATYATFASVWNALSPTAVTADTLVVIASFGNLGAAGLAGDTVPGGQTATARQLFDEVLRRFGAPRDISSLTTNDAFILMGYKDMGVGSGFFKVATRDVANSQGGVVEGRVMLVGDQLVGADGRPDLAPDPFIVPSNATATGSTRATSGAMHVAGGMGIAQDLFVGNALVVESTDAATGSAANNSGALHVAGGAGIGGALFVGGALNVSGALTASGGLTIPTGQALTLTDANQFTVGGTPGTVDLGTGALHAAEVVASQSVQAQTFTGHPSGFGSGGEVNVAFDDGGKLHMVMDDDGDLATGSTKVLTLSDSKVGILTDTPTQALDVAGNIRATGSIETTSGNITTTSGNISTGGIVQGTAVQVYTGGGVPNRYGAMRLEHNNAASEPSCDDGPRADNNKNICFECFDASANKVGCGTSSTERWCLCLEGGWP